MDIWLGAMLGKALQACQGKLLHRALPCLPHCTRAIIAGWRCRMPAVHSAGVHALGKPTSDPTTSGPSSLCPAFQPVHPSSPS